MGEGGGWRREMVLQTVSCKREGEEKLKGDEKVGKGLRGDKESGRWGGEGIMGLGEGQWGRGTSRRNLI